MLEHITKLWAKKSNMEVQVALILSGYLVSDPKREKSKRPVLFTVSLNHRSSIDIQRRIRIVQKDYFSPPGM